MQTIINELSAIELIERELSTLPEDVVEIYRGRLDECKQKAHSLQNRIDTANRL